MIRCTTHTTLRCAAFAVLFLLLHACFAQRQPLVPDGKPQTLSTALQPFGNLELLWIDGLIEVEFGADTSSLHIVTDENIARLIRVEQTGNTLKISIEGNEHNRLWLEDERTEVRIRTTAQPLNIVYQCNANATLRDISTDALSLEKGMNGDLQLVGTARSLRLRKSGNGTVFAKTLAVETADVEISGNGDAQLNAQKFTARTSTGNGHIINATDAPSPTAAAPLKRVQVQFFNNQAKRGNYFVTGTNGAGRTFSYGLELGAFARQSETLPVGTQIFKGNRSGKLVATLSERDDQQTLKLAD